MADVPVEKRPPTPGLRVELVHSADEKNQVISIVAVAEEQYAANGTQSTPEEDAQAMVDAEYINWLIETDELRKAHQQFNEAGLQTDVLVDMGNMAGQSIRQVNIQNEAYEAMVEDILGNFNHIVTQGIQPIVALHAMGFAFAITLGACLRANLADNEADALLFIVRNNAKNEAGRLKLVTKQ